MEVYARILRRFINERRLFLHAIDERVSSAFDVGVYHDVVEASVDQWRRIL
ncbi:hypothetical protein [Shouchella shacheensis]|uniref:hypothetical protein n=1 Tax=Shouchella shacheensis TaxID=1649580 RepID=UPI000AFC4ACA|nr:hypothetical protein [Shouchella shacheensis]